MRLADYVQETTTSIAGTLGDGAVTLSAIAGSPRFSTVFGTQATVCQYVIEDVVNHKFEKGIGSVAGNVLTRTTPRITWDGAAWLDNAPAALQFGAAPASGNVIVRIAATIDNSVAAMPQPQSLIAADSFRDYPFSAAITGAIPTNAAANLTVGREHYFAYKLDRSGSLAGVQFSVITAAAGSLKLALYACGPDGLPGAKICDFNTLSVSTTGIKTDTASGTWTPNKPPFLSPGWYFIGFITDVACAIAGYNQSGGSLPTPLGRRGSYGNAHVAYIAGSYAAGLPAAPNLTGGSLMDPGGSNTGAAGLAMGLKIKP